MMQSKIIHPRFVHVFEKDEIFQKFAVVALEGERFNSKYRPSVQTPDDTGRLVEFLDICRMRNKSPDAILRDMPTLKVFYKVGVVKYSNAPVEYNYLEGIEIPDIQAAIDLANARLGTP